MTQKKILEKTRCLIALAAPLAAKGHTTKAIAEKLGVHCKSIARCRREHPEEWQKVYDKELSTAISASRLESDQYIKMLQESNGANIKHKTRELIVQAIPLIAKGKTFREAAVMLDVKCSRLMDVRKVHRELWDNFLQAERKRLIKAGETDCTRDYADREELAETSLMQFLHHVYIPSRLDITADSVYQLERAVRQFTAFAGDVAVGELTDDMVCRHLKDLMKRGKSPITINADRAKLLALWRCAWRKRLIDDQPRDIPRCKEPRHVPQAWTAEEIQRLVRYAETLTGFIGDLPKSWFWSSLILAAFETGLRIGALRQLKTADVDLDIPAIIARAETQKTGVDQLCYLSPYTAELLAECLPSNLDQQVWLWPHCRRHFDVCFRRVVEAAGLTASHKGRDLFHKIRRTHLSYIARESLEAARRAAGHTHASTTEKHYIDPRILNTPSAVALLPRVVPSCTRAITLDVKPTAQSDQIRGWEEITHAAGGE